jgi:hypothetical protein
MGHLHGAADFVSGAHDRVEEEDLTLVDVGRQLGEDDAGLVGLKVAVDLGTMLRFLKYFRRKKMETNWPFCFKLLLFGHQKGS